MGNGYYLKIVYIPKVIILFWFMFLIYSRSISYLILMRVCLVPNCCGACMLCGRANEIEIFLNSRSLLFFFFSFCTLIVAFLLLVNFFSFRRNFCNFIFIMLQFISYDEFKLVQHTTNTYMNTIVDHIYNS